MSGSAGGADPSMEEILASIRRILNDDDTAPGKAAAAPETLPEPPPEAVPHEAAPEDDPDVFALDASMMVGAPPEPPPEPPPLPELPSLHVRLPEPEPEPIAAPPPVIAPVVVPIAPAPPTLVPLPPLPPLPGRAGLIGPDTAAAAAHSVGSLRRTLEAGRSLSVRSGGPTLDDIVREELRPILKAWLDAHLPAVVERLVQAEIERVVGRADL